MADRPESQGSLMHMEASCYPHLATTTTHWSMQVGAKLLKPRWEVKVYGLPAGSKFPKGIRGQECLLTTRENFLALTCPLSSNLLATGSNRLSSSFTERASQTVLLPSLSHEH